VAEGGTNTQAYQDPNAIWHQSYISQFFGRPQRQLLGSMNYFLTTGPLGHEFKVGGSYRLSETRSKSIWPGGVIAFDLGSGACKVACGALTRQSGSKVNDKYTGIFFQDTLTMDRLTATLGVRYDHQTSSVMSSSVPGTLDTAYAAILPGASQPARSDVVKWNDWSPRVGLTYALGADRKTLLRASYARYANGLGAYPATSLQGIPGVAYAYYPWTDTNGNHLVDPGELNTTTPIRTINFNPANPSSPQPVNFINPNLTSQKTNEYVAGIDHEVLPNFAVGASYTHRDFSNFYFSYRSFDGTVPPYVLDHMNTGTLPDGTAFSVPVYSICLPNTPTACPTGAVPPGSFFTQRPNYSQSFDGAELTMTKRMSSGWMARANFAWNNSKQKVGAGACADPTNTQYSTGEDYVPGGCANGPVAPNAGSGSGAFGNVNLYSKWSFNMSGAYQLPLGFTVGGNYFGRQGYPIAWYVIDATAKDGFSKRVYVGAVDAYRYGWVSQFDLRLDKNIPITSTVSATLALDAFNVMNLTTVTQRNSRLKQTSLSTGTNTVFETQSPRILRLSGRISF
jgi:hypothetical protein